MNDEQNVAPAGETQETVAQVPENEVLENQSNEEPSSLSLEDAVALEDEADRAEGKAQRDENGRFAKTGDDQDAENIPDETEPAEAGSDDGDEQDFIDGNAQTRLRDGRVVKVADLKKSYDEAEQIRQAAPEIQKYAESLQNQAQQIAQQRAELEQIIANIRLPEQAMAQPPSMELLESDPIAYIQQKEAWEAAGRMQQYQAMHQQEAKQRQEAERSENRKRHLASQAELLAKAAPDLKDPKVATEFQKDYMEVVKAYGFTEREASEVYDHRLLIAMRDLARLRKLESGGKQDIEHAKARARGARPGEANASARAPANSRKVEQVESLRQRAKQSGSLEDVLKLENALNS